VSEEIKKDTLLATGLAWKQIKDDKDWDDFLAWCRDQENTAHE
jgi:hypothetical protein